MASDTHSETLHEKKGDQSMLHSPDTDHYAEGAMKPGKKLEGAVNPAQDALAILKLVVATDVHHPLHWAAWKRWGIIFVYTFLQLFVTLTSTTYVSAEWLIQEEFGGSTQVVTLGQSLFIIGNAVGPAFLGPLS